jgi:hypothetical protein
MATRAMGRAITRGREAAIRESTVLNIVVVAQAGRIGYQALLCAASIRAFHAADQTRILVCMPQNSPRWEKDPAIRDAELLRGFRRYDCELAEFDNSDFGSSYPHANKFYSIARVPTGEPFLFLDSDSVLTAPIEAGDLSPDRPALKRGGGSWPVAGEDGRSIGEVWRSVYAFFGIDPAPWRDPDRGDDEHQCYPYYNGGIVYHADAQAFAALWLEMALRLWRERPAAIAGQPIKPWLDQIVLPVVLARLGVTAEREPDPIHKTVVHYHFPFYLQVRHARAAELFEKLTGDPTLAATLRADQGFRYYMSDEGRGLVRGLHDEFLRSGKQGGYKRFLEMLRPRVPLMR